MEYPRVDPRALKRQPQPLVVLPRRLAAHADDLQSVAAPHNTPAPAKITWRHLVCGHDVRAHVLGLHHAWLVFSLVGGEIAGQAVLQNGCLTQVKERGANLVAV